MRVIIVMIVLLAALVLAGCGGDGDEPQSEAERAYNDCVEGSDKERLPDFEEAIDRAERLGGRFLERADSTVTICLLLAGEVQKEEGGPPLVPDEIPEDTSVPEGSIPPETYGGGE